MTDRQQHAYERTAELAETAESSVSVACAKSSAEPRRSQGICKALRDMGEAARLNALTEQIISAAIAVHGHLGPGLLESVYEDCMALELAERGLRFEQQRRLPVFYRGRAVGAGYRVDLLVEDLVIVEMKCVERFEPVHSAQVLSYLRLSGCKVGLLLNFYVKWFTDKGIKRLVLGFPE